jgi:hypothetical protein
MNPDNDLFVQNFLLKKQIHELKKENQNISSQLFNVSNKIDNIGNHVIDYTNNIVSNVQDISNNTVLRAGHTRPVLNNTHSYFSSTLRTFWLR